jgi:MOSC domain-containing protein YiiM
MRCQDCGFDLADWDDGDLRRTVRQADTFIARATEGLPEALQAAVDALPAPPDLPGGAGAAPADGGATDAGSQQQAHALWHRCWAIARLRADAGDLPAEQHGVVQQLNASNGGVPKRPMPEAEIARRGLRNDHQAARRHHGRVWQALCLWSVEVVEALQAEGHPIGLGSAGENITIRGLDWSTLRSGLIVDIGAVRSRLSVPATPCYKNDQWFAGTGSRRMDHDRHPGWSRWYAIVERGGTVRSGDPAVLAPRDG